MGFGPPGPPLDPHLLSRPAGDGFFSIKSSLGGIFQFYLNFDRPRFCQQTVASGDPTCGSRGGLGGPDTPPPWKITSYIGFFGHPHPLEEVGPPPPLCNKTIGSTL